MAELSGLDMVREIIGQINNLRRLVTINGKKYKWDGKKYVRAVDGRKFTKKELVSYVKDEQFKAPKVPDPKKIERNKSLKTKIKDKAKSVTRNIKKTKPQFNKDVINRPLANLKLRISQPNLSGNTKVSNALKMNKYLKGLTPGNVVQGVKGLGAGIGINWAAQSLFDRTMRNIEGKQKMHIDDYRAMRDERNANVPKTLKAIRRHRQASQPQRIIGQRGRTTGYIQPEQTGGVIGRRNEQYINREPQVSYKPQEEVTPPNQGTDSTKKNETVDKVKIKKVKFNPNAPDMGYNTKKTQKKKSKKKDELKIHGKNPSAIQKKLLKAGITKEQIETLVTNYNKKYRSKRGW